MSRYDAIDLSQVPPPDSVTVLDFDTAFNNWLGDFVAQANAYGATYNVQSLRSDPIGWALRVAAYRGDILLNQRVNDGIKAVLLATATGGDLDNVVADFSLVRKTLIAADPATNTPAVMESDASLRARRALAPEALSSAGPYGAYRFFAMQAHPDVADAGVYGPEYDFVEDGRVVVCVMSASNNGAPPASVLRAVSTKLRAWESPDLPGWVHPSPTALDADNLRPDTDYVIVRACQNVNYTVQATIVVPPGADADALRVASQARVQAYCQQMHHENGVVTLDGLIAAGRMMDASGLSPLKRFILQQPVADVVAGPLNAPFLAGLVRFTVEVDRG